MCIQAMLRGNVIEKYLGGIIAIALGDVPWMNRNLRFVAGLSLLISTLADFQKRFERRVVCINDFVAQS